jgi:ubiquinone/menaquinone biosynthesis C-methylase UbiE
VRSSTTIVAQPEAATVAACRAKRSMISSRAMSGWESDEVAKRWKANAEMRNRYLAAATQAMFDLARLAPGRRVLDLGTGAGDVALRAAGIVGPQGKVVAIDSSPGMVEAARGSVREAGTANVTVAEMDAQSLSFPEASFDAVLARMVLMFVEDLPRALAGIARVLAPGGRFAATTWSAIERNPFHSALHDVARGYGPLPDPPPEIVRAFRLSDLDALRRALTAAGFRDVEVRTVGGERVIPSIAEELEHQKTFPPVALLFARLSASERGKAWTEVARRWRAYERPDGACVFPQEMLVLGAAGGGAHQRRPELKGSRK